MTISARPRVHRNQDSSRRVVPGRCRRRNAPAPALHMNTGAQMCVTQRVRKMIGVVRVRSSGEKLIAPAWMKSRV